MTSEQTKRLYEQRLKEWREKYDIKNKPESMSEREWHFEASMMKPNEPGYYRANKRLIMKIGHLEFADELSISVISYPDFTIDIGFMEKKELSFKRNEDLSSEKLQYLIRHCINMDEWKHSWHLNLSNEENYEKFLKIIQEKIIDRDRQLRILFEGLFQLQKELEKTEDDE